MRLLITILTVLPYILIGQNHKKSHHKAQLITVFNPLEAQPDFNAQLFYLEAPLPDGDTYRSFLMQQKQKQYERIKSLKPKSGKAFNEETGPPPIKGRNFGMRRTLPGGTDVTLTGGIPNDNSLAVSNDGKLLSAINSLVYGYDLVGDSVIFPNSLLSLSGIAGGASIQDFYFDPKLIYDEQADRFILVFLKNSDPSSNGYIVAFSSSNNPLDPWYSYFLSGNPLNNDRWTDFPAISLSNGQLYITGNLIIDTAPTWQEGFDGSIIWQVDTQQGYDGEEEINSELYSDIRFEDNYIRNLHPVQGARGQAEDAYFMSNRNFDLENDTMFVLHLDMNDDGDTSLTINYARTDVPYGMPPNGRQQDTDPSDPTGGLQTNDARVLGAILHEGEIRFVANTVNSETGFSAVYFGEVSNPANNPEISGKILGDSLLDYGYPNIAFAGNENCDAELMIGFNYTSPDSFPGIACKYISNSGEISETLILKEGEDYVNRLTGTYERWGDYLGFQTKFNEPGKVYSSGYFGLIGKRNATWINEIISPDTTKIYISASQDGNPINCNGILLAEVSNGTPPFTYFWNGKEGSEKFEEACLGESVTLVVRDARGCSSGIDLIPENQGASEIIYPNPATNRVNFKFNLKSDAEIKAVIYDMSGKSVAEIIKKNAKAGLNEIQFFIDPLAKGVYFLNIESNSNVLFTERFVKAND